MIPLELQSPRDVAKILARRVKLLRLDQGWTQAETAERAGIALSTYQLFERSGRISLERLLKLAVILDARAGLGQLFLRPPASSLAELEAQTGGETRKRGKRRDAEA